MSSVTDSSSTSSRGEASAVRVRRAMEGDLSSLTWVVRRFTPLLLIQARYHLGAGPDLSCEPEDLVSDVWSRALPRLARLHPRNGNEVLALRGYLSRILLRRCAKLQALQARDITTEPIRDEGKLAGELSGVVTHAVRQETAGHVVRLLERLDARDRQVIVLRGIERHSYERMCARMGESRNALKVRYRRALLLLRGWLPRGVFLDLEDE